MAVFMLSDASIPSMLFLASTWWSKTEKADVLKITRCQQDPFAYRYRTSESGSLQGF